MNKSALKKYAPQARLDFIAAVTRRAEQLGLNPQSPAKVEKQGEALLINGQAFPAAYGRMRTTLEARIREQGFTQVMEAMAYTWFNRLVAVRYMELHGFLDHGYRVLSHPANEDTGHTQPEILDHIPELDLPDFDKEQALELKLAGNRDEELYREVLLAQCHALHKAMPFLFESLDDATELLLPDGLLRTDSILGKLVTAIDEADWQDVEIIGWLYQFYISEKKDQVIGKVVKSEDIPAATQLFTPNWIVKYLVQNSLGRLWLMANPTSTLATKWEYYIKPAEQTPEVNAQLDALIQARIAEDGATLNPESLTLLDPACGSGHILVEAYDLLRDIYLERGYRRQDIPRLILEKNLYGLDIDDRAAQLAGFALLMKARSDDRRLFGQPVGLNVLALQEAKEGSAAELHSALNAPQIDYAMVSQLVQAFEQAKTFGSLIQIPDELASALPGLRQELEAVREGGDLLGRDAAETLLRLVAQAEVQAMQFDAVVANPPYMGSGYFNSTLKKWASKRYKTTRSDIYAIFIERYLRQLKRSGGLSFVTRQDWMFTKSFVHVRELVRENHTLTDLVQLGSGAFEFLTGEVTQAAAFSILGFSDENYFSTFVDCRAKAGKDEAFFNYENRFVRPLNQFPRKLGSPLLYYLDNEELHALSMPDSLSDFYTLREGIHTGDNGEFVRNWWEVSSMRISFDSSSLEDFDASKARWAPYNKGGCTYPWYWGTDFVVRFDSPTRERMAKIKGHVRPSQALYFKEGGTWSDVATKGFGVRYFEEGHLFDGAGPVVVCDDIFEALARMNSMPFVRLAEDVMPNLHFKCGTLQMMPHAPASNPSEAAALAKSAVRILKSQAASSESQLGFQLPKLNGRSRSIEDEFNNHVEAVNSSISEICDLEAKNNAAYADAYALDRPESWHPDPTKYDWLQLDALGIAGSTISYSIGCMMGRYSLDAPGLIYAHAGNEGFDPSRYETFPADDDGIVPISDEAWFDDDGANRIREFVRVVWGEDTEAENMAWLAESLGSKASESADDTIRRYLSRDFYKDHLQTYKKRPIYWLFSSGKHKAFEALVYLHRYNAGTLSRMRMEYVVPLQSRMQARIDNLDQDIQSSTSSAEQKRFQKQKDKLIKQLDELRRFDENLRHYADQRITLDLDDGVKVNYGKFGDLLAEVKAVTGKKQ